MKSCSCQPTSPGPLLPDEIETSFARSDSADGIPVSALSTVAHLQPSVIASAALFRFRSLRAGCYYTTYVPSPGSPILNINRFFGTIRVEKPDPARTTASGDLYSYPILAFPPSAVVAPPAPGTGIPIFPRSRYRYYLRITQILEGLTASGGFTLGFQRFSFNPTTGAWTNDGAFTAAMTWTPAPASYPSSGDYLTGQVRNAANAVVGTLTMGWVSGYLRRCTVEVDTVSGSESPLTDGGAINWQTIGDQIGWQITAFTSSTNTPAPSGDSWSDAEMHAAMLARRDSANLDAEWRYHVLAVRNIDSTPRGIMYDNGGTDSNNVPREGIGIASHWVIPNANPWGLVKGQRFGAATKPYFRTALHEIGHAMGLFHNTVNNGIMNTTDVIAANAPAGTPFPNNIVWSHATDDQKRLRHFPDVFVRPGGQPFGTSFAATPLSPDDEALPVPGLALKVLPLLDAVPLGAPVRVDIELVNESDSPLEAPAKLGLKTEFVTGNVRGPAGDDRGFAPFQHCAEDHATAVLAPGEKVRGALTLLRGGDGALFGSPGVHEISVEVSWDIGGVPVTVSGAATVMIGSPVDASHQAAAHAVLSTPDVHLVLALGGDHLPAGIAAIERALADKTLRPHFAFCEARRVGSRFMKRAANPKAAAHLLADAVVSRREAEKAVELLQGGKDPAVKKTAKSLHDRAARLGASDEALAALKSL